MERKREWDAIATNPKDDVAVALRQLSRGATVRVWIDSAIVEVTAADPIPLGHKLALRDLKTGAAVLKFGLPIGNATAEIRTGSHVHVHNVRSARAQRQPAGASSGEKAL